MKPFGIVIHGGAGVIPRESSPELIHKYTQEMQRIIDEAYRKLDSMDSALDVVCQSVKALEDFILFNAGKGAVYNSKGEHECDASVMEGKHKRCGAVAGLKHIEHPILLARDVMEKSQHVLLIGDGAEEFALENAYQLVDNNFFDSDFRKEQWLKAKSLNRVILDHSNFTASKNKGTVGAVACDKNGNLAAATSTGGMTNKKFGRVGDSPIIGAGTYADNSVGAVSCTGDGEEFIRHSVASQIIFRSAYASQTLASAAHYVVHHILQKDDGGIIAIDPEANLIAEFNSIGMFRAGINNKADHFCKIWD